MIQAILYALFAILGFSIGSFFTSLAENRRVKDTIKHMAEDSRPVMVDGKLYKIEEAEKC